MFCLYVILLKYTFKIQSIVKGSFPLIFFEVGFPSLVCADDSYSFTFEKDFLLVVSKEVAPLRMPEAFRIRWAGMFGPSLPVRRA